jgi:hypothetical protein
VLVDTGHNYSEWDYLDGIRRRDQLQRRRTGDHRGGGGLVEGKVSTGHSRVGISVVFNNCEWNYLEGRLD